MTNILQRLRNPKCTGCKLHQTAEYVCLLGDGDVPSRVMAIGEAPGKREDDSGKPFVGSAGKKLEELGEAAGWNIRKEWFITNAVHCRPPDNKTPTKGQIKACGDWLKLETKYVKPEWVILLGATALKAVFGSEHKISDVRGQVIEREGIKYFSTFHPSFILHDPRKEPVLLADLKKFRALVDGVTTKGKLKGFDPVYVDSEDKLDELCDALATHYWASWDTETTGLFPFKQNLDPHGVVTLGFNVGGKQYVIPLYHPEVNGKMFMPPHKIVKRLDPLVLDIILVGHNSKFDSLWMRKVYGVRWYADFDTILAAHLLDENRSLDLKTLAMDYFDAPDYSLNFEKKSPFFYPLKQVLEYHALDIYYTGELYHVFKRQLKDDRDLHKLFYNLTMPVSTMLTDAEFKGVWVDRLRANRTMRNLQRTVKGCQRDLDRLFPGVNWNSNPQVGEVLFEKLGYPVLQSTDGGAASVAEAVLLQLRSMPLPKGVTVNLPALILELREAAKNLSTFVEPWLNEWCDAKDRIHPSFKIFGTVTGRLSCAEPNLQNVPRNPDIRSNLGAPPGRVFLSADLSQIELRIVAHVANVMAMKIAFATGQDVHKMTAQAILGVEEPTKEERKKAKAVNFGFLYGMWWKKFIIYARDNYQVEVSDEEAEAAREAFFEKYPELVTYHERQRTFARRNGYVRGLQGRKRRLPDAMIEYGPHDRDAKFKKMKRDEAWRQAINSPIQGFASDLNLMVGLAVRKEFPENKLDIIGVVHDELLIECDEDISEKVIKFIQKTTKWPPLLSKFIDRLTVPLDGSASVGQWGSGIERKEAA